ncbi:hypothetical protein HS1genome_1892 [Sulfodiicoccus acidiphilus]|uniref:SAM-dependent methyltransferase TRM5/TYW2-type domain-containing protein n=1 Tax=Sulfodiicoccus acidiphilus TaxID=1670455 RepID=A0A348B5Q1_9CREN|nr:hypothetical protein [Sulfodiicoccus acidiphilus]BBD73503.1 hypothetical protein HS1genome_1892 [Sulfodiicoccus acidiphilus]GGT92695.1 hypothetical protein GCM10007116_08080 [Sulfodiicoccus acidiphilus]
MFDVGDSIGETALFFSLKGAKNLVAVEVKSRKVALMELNLKENGLNNIEVVEGGVSLEDGGGASRSRV